MNLFLDDIRDPWNTTHVELPYATWTTVRDYDEFVSTITAYHAETGNLPNHIAYDHDLACIHYAAGDDAIGDLVPTGLECAKWVIQFCINHDLVMTEFSSHSMNPVGKANILRVLQHFTDQQQG